jgi:thiamine kinase-like enzyme
LHTDWNAKTTHIAKAGGQTNRNYVVTYKNQKFFVRLPWETHVIDRTIEGKNILALSKNKKLVAILPKYYVYILNKKNILNAKDPNGYDVPDGTIVAQYIEGREFTTADFKETKSQKMLLQAFFAFHTSGVRFVNTYDVFCDEIEKYRVEAQKYSLQEIVSIETIVTLTNLEKRAKKKLSVLKKGVPAHNDFIFQNFFIGKNKKVYLLDFEYAGMNMRGGIYYDFGFLFADSLFRKPVTTKEVFEQFLAVADKVYGKKLDREQIYAAIQAVIVMQVWWGILRYFSVQTQKEKQYFTGYVQARATKVKDLSKSFQM